MIIQRPNASVSKAAFTIVELLIVIVVIVILAAITIVAYTNVQKNAAEAAVKSDLSQAAKNIVITKSKTGCPSNADNIPKSENTVYSNFTCEGSDFCIQASDKKYTDISYYIDQNGSVAQGSCVASCEPGHGNCEGDGDGEYDGPPASSIVVCPVQSGSVTVGWFTPPASEIPSFKVSIGGYPPQEVTNDRSVAGTFVYDLGSSGGTTTISVAYRNTLGLLSTETTKTISIFATDCYD
jgi:prepilin-type N-terminal cleavage/methylation domain-containing protein